MHLVSMTFNGLTGFARGLSLPKLGKITTFVGPNSSGKTTALQVIHSLLTFLSGRAFDAAAKTRKGDWLHWESAVVRLDVASPVDDLAGKPTSFVELHVAHRDSTLRIVRVDTASSALRLNEQVLHRENTDTKT